MTFRDKKKQEKYEKELRKKKKDYPNKNGNAIKGIFPGKAFTIKDHVTIFFLKQENMWWQLIIAYSYQNKQLSIINFTINKLPNVLVRKIKEPYIKETETTDNAIFSAFLKRLDFIYAIESIEKLSFTAYEMYVLNKEVCKNFHLLHIFKFDMKHKDIIVNEKQYNDKIKLAKEELTKNLPKELLLKMDEGRKHIDLKKKELAELHKKKQQYEGKNIEIRKLTEEIKDMEDWNRKYIPKDRRDAFVKEVNGLKSEAASITLENNSLKYFKLLGMTDYKNLSTKRFCRTCGFIKKPHSELLCYMLVEFKYCLLFPSWALEL